MCNLMFTAWPKRESNSVFPPSASFKILCCHEDTWFHQNFSSVQSLSHVQLFVTPWTAAYQASLFIADSWSLLKLLSMESVMPSNLCHPLLLLPSILPIIRVFSNESALCIWWPSIGVSPSESVLPMNVQG